MKTQKPQHPHGGARPGAARPPISGTGKAFRRYIVQLSDEHVEKAKKLGNDNLAAGVRIAVERS